MSDILLTDAVVLTMDPARTAYSNGYVWIRNDRIQEVGAMPAPATLPAGTAIRSMNKRHLVMPGLINAHNHISNNVVRGTFDEGSREDYGTRMFAALRALDGDASYAGALSSLVEQLCGGITTTQAGEFGHVDRPAGVLRAITMRGCVLSSRWPSWIAQTRQSTRKPYRKSSARRLRRPSLASRLWNAGSVRPWQPLPPRSSRR